LLLLYIIILKIDASLSRWRPHTVDGNRAQGHKEICGLKINIQSDVRSWYFPYGIAVILLLYYYYHYLCSILHPRFIIRIGTYNIIIWHTIYTYLYLSGIVVTFLRDNIQLYASYMYTSITITEKEILFAKTR